MVYVLLHRKACVHDAMSDVSSPPDTPGAQQPGVYQTGWGGVCVWGGVMPLYITHTTKITRTAYTT